jgi:hypothetical protein
MSAPRMRPRFELQLPVEADQWLGALQSQLRTDAAPCRGAVFRCHANLWMHDAQRTFWSPYLNLDIDEQPGGIAVRGRFSPHPNVWMLFMGIYALLGIAALSGLIYGFVQFSLGRHPWALIAVPVAAAVFGFVYGATLIGQGLGAEQMYTLRRVVDGVSESVCSTESA